MKASVGVNVLRSAVARRRPTGQVVHSDRGSQSRATAFVRELRTAGLTGSMGRVGACADAAMESSLALLRQNFFDRRRWATREDLRLTITTWTERTQHRRRGASADSGA